ncbi:MAG TPA: hypothetical protein VN690_03455 [Terriglobales bacterium]|nr:hypothetical protein [Terriglobales bacterium]
MLVGVLGFLGVRTSVALRADVLRIGDAAASYSVRKGVMLRALTGYDVFGREQLALPGAYRHFVVFAVRAAEFDHDTAFWATVRSYLRDRAEIELFGICDSPACAAAVRQAKPLPFLVLGDAGWSAIQYIHSADRDGDALLVGSKSAIEEAIPWRTNISAMAAANELRRSN